MPKNNNSLNETLGGKYLSTSNLSKDELIKRLKKLSSYLSEVEQDNVDTRDLDTAAAGLVQEVILHHKDKEVKIFAACCLADIIRIYAPDPPYNDVQLKEVFQLFIEQLGHLDPEKPTFDRYVYLLERLVLVKAFVLLVELDEDSVNELFSTLFKVVSDEHSNAIRTHFLDIMVSCIEESTEVPNALLETVLQTLVSPYKNEHPAATKLGQLLIKRFSNLFQPIIAQYLVDLKEPDAQSELKDNYNELIYELNRISPSLIITVLPLLETELKIEDNSKRKNTVNLLQFMFGAKNSTLAANYRTLFSVFLGRFNDKEADIRAKMLEFAKSYLTTHTQFITDVNEGLRNRVLDPDIKIRQLAVEYVCDIASETPDNITIETMNAVFERLQDKKEVIRKEAMKRLSSLYKKIVEKFGEDFDSWSEQSVTKFSKIPQKLLHCYFLPDPADKSRVEKHFDNLLPSDVDKKAKSMWKIYQSVDPNAVVAIQRILKEKRSFQTGFESLLEHRNDADSDEAKKKLTSLSNKLPYPDRAHDGLSKILTLKDNVTIKHLTTLYDVDVKYSTIKTAKAEVLKKLEGKKVNYCKKIVQHLALSFISKETVNVIYKSLKKLKSNSKEFFSGLKLLQDISVVYPSFFSEIFSQLSSLLEEKDEAVVNNALMIMSNVGQTLQEKDPSLIKEVKDKLYDLCSTGTPFQAKQAVKAMQHMYQDKSGKVFGSLAKECVKELDLKDKQLPTLLKTLGYIAELSPSSFDSVKTKVVNFLESLLEKSHSKKKSKDQNGPSSECEKKILAIKVLIHYLMASSEEDTELIFLLLIKILTSGGELTSDESTSSVDRSYLSFTAGSGVVKLCRLPRYERRLSPEQFQLLATIVQSSESNIRASFAKKLHKGLNTFQLPIRFMSLFSLAATDSDKSNIASARHYLANCIKLRQTYMKTNETISSKPTLQAQFMPEYSVPYLVHLLAHHENIDEDRENKYANTYRCLSFYLSELYSANNYSFLMNLLFGIRRTKDAVTPDSNNIHVIAEICNKELLRLSGAKKRGELNVAAPSVDMFLPPSLYSLPSESEAMDIIKQSDNISNFTIPNKKSTPAKPKKSAESDEEKEEDQEDKEKDKKKTPKKTPQKTPTKKGKESDEEKTSSTKKSSKKTPKKSDKDEEEQEEEVKEEEENKKKTPSSSKKHTKKKSSEDKDDSKKNSSKKGSKKSGKEEAEDVEEQEKDDQEEEEEEEKEEKKSSSKKSSKKTTSKKTTSKSSKKAKRVEEEEAEEEEEEVPLKNNSKKRKSSGNSDSDKENKQKSKTNSKKQKKSTKN